MLFPVFVTSVWSFEAVSASLLSTCVQKTFSTSTVTMTFYLLTLFELYLNRSFKWSFSENNLFKKEPEIAHEFAEHFRNITSNIMDCVACEKCKLWGKIQIHGLGTAFKILTHEDRLPLHLTRHEITSLINGITKLSRSIQFLEEFDKLIQQEQHNLSSAQSLPSTKKQAGQIPAFF